MRIVLLFCCLVLLAFSAPALAGEVTSDVLSIEDVTPMLKSFVSMKPEQRLLEVYGVSQSDDNKHAKIFFKYMKAGRGGAKPDKGELNCFKLNSGKWYCGGVYDILRK